MRTPAPTTARILAFIAAGVVALATLWLLFGPAARWLAGDDLAQLSAKERLDATAAIQGRIAAVLGSAFVGGGLYYTARRYFLDRDKQFTDRYNAAVDHLGSSDETLRAGGVRALDRILDDSPSDRERVLETITSFLRRHTRDTEPTTAHDRADINAAVATIRRPRRTRKAIDQPLDLRSARLPEANLRQAPLARADLTNAHLERAILTAADPTEATLDSAALTAATLASARLRHASLRHTALTRANLTSTDCTGTDLTEADLTGATLTSANLSNAILINTDLRGTDLTQTHGLTNEQLKRAKVDERTRTPAGLHHPLQNPN